MPRSVSSLRVFLKIVAFTRPRRCNLLRYMYLKSFTMPTYGALHILHPVSSPKVLLSLGNDPYRSNDEKVRFNSER